jgi:DNA-binding NarL/FixJ family response regulator
LDEKNIEVIVIEDNSMFRKALVDVLNKSELMYCRHNYGAAEDALFDIKSKEFLPDVVLMDIGLPGMNGIECIPHIKELSPDSKVIMLTIHDEDDNIFEAICSGAAGYLLKDASAEEIAQSVQSVIMGGAPIDAHIAKKILDIFKKLTAQPVEYGLTKREKEILKLLVKGLSKKKIANTLFISFHTVDTHIRRIYEKLEVHTRSGAIAKALKERLV